MDGQTRQAKQGLGFDRDSFLIDFATRTATCPGGKTSVSWTPRAHMAGDGAAILFSEHDCRPCVRREHCTTSMSAGRQIVIPPRQLYEIQRSCRTAQQDPQWKRRYGTRGGPESPLRSTVKSTRNLADALTAAGHKVSAPTVAVLLKEEGFSLQGNAKTLEGRQHADRDAQFRYSNARAREHMNVGDPVMDRSTQMVLIWQPPPARTPVQWVGNQAGGALTGVGRPSGFGRADRLRAPLTMPGKVLIGCAAGRGLAGGSWLAPAAPYCQRRNGAGVMACRVRRWR